MPRPTTSRLDPSLRRGASIAGAGLVALAVLGAVAVLAAGSGGDDRQVSVPQMEVPAGWLDLLLGALGALTLVVWVGLVVSAVSDRSGDPTVRPSRTIPGMLLAGALLWFTFTVWSPADEPVVIEAPPPASEVEPTGDDPVTTDPASPSGSSTWWLLAGAALVLAAVALLGWAGRGGVAPPPPDPDGEAHRRRHLLIGLLDDALADLRTHPDPRSAVIAAWARLEGALAIVDVPRDPGDTPSRYLAKVLATVEASAGAVERFTGAFERAMFSPDEITPTDQQAAVDALVTVRDELHLLDGRPTTGAPV